MTNQSKKQEVLDALTNEYQTVSNLYKITYITTSTIRTHCEALAKEGLAIKFSIKEVPKGFGKTKTQIIAAYKLPEL